MATTEEQIVAVETAPEPVIDVLVEENPAPTKARKAKEPKAKKPAALKKPRSPPSHPPYEEMIKDAIVALKEKTGSSQYAITRYIEEKQKNMPANFKKLVLFHLKKLDAAGKLTRVRSSFKLPSTRTPPLKPVLPAKKKSIAAVKAKSKTLIKPKASKTTKLAVKPKPAAKLKPKSTAKPKSDPVKSKPAAKPKAAAPKPKAKEKPAKVARTSSRTTPGKKVPAAKPVTKKAPAAKKATAKTVKPKSVKSPTRKTPARIGKK